LASTESPRPDWKTGSQARTHPFISCVLKETGSQLGMYLPVNLKISHMVYTTGAVYTIPVLRMSRKSVVEESRWCSPARRARCSNKTHTSNWAIILTIKYDSEPLRSSHWISLGAVWLQRKPAARQRSCSTCCSAHFLLRS